MPQVKGSLSCLQFLISACLKFFEPLNTITISRHRLGPFKYKLTPLRGGGCVSVSLGGGADVSKCKLGGGGVQGGVSLHIEHGRNVKSNCFKFFFRMKNTIFLNQLFYVVMYTGDAFIILFLSH